MLFPIFCQRCNQCRPEGGGGTTPRHLINVRANRALVQIHQTGSTSRSVCSSAGSRVSRQSHRLRAIDGHRHGGRRRDSACEGTERGWGCGTGLRAPGAGALRRAAGGVPPPGRRAPRGRPVSAAPVPLANHSPLLRLYCACEESYPHPGSRALALAGSNLISREKVAAGQRSCFF